MQLEISGKVECIQKYGQKSRMQLEIRGKIEEQNKIRKGGKEEIVIGIGKQLKKKSKKRVRKGVGEQLRG